MRTRDFKVGKRVRMASNFRKHAMFPFLTVATGTITGFYKPEDEIAVVTWDDSCRTDRDNDPRETTVHRSNLELIPTRFQTLAAVARVNAKRFAELFVEEFGEPLDRETTDWDSQAWANTEWGDDLPTPADAEKLWPIFAEALAKETRAIYHQTR